MPKYNMMISKAVDLVARKLAGMDPDTVSRLTQILGEEAQKISESLQNSGENVNADILAARLDGVVARLKYEARNQAPDPSPHEFPIFNVSHNPTTPYPNPINHLYDKRYKEAYSTFIKQNQPPKNEPSTPPSPPVSSVAKPPVSPSSSSYPSYPQGHFQRQPAQSAGFRQQPTGNWQYANPYATMPRSNAAYHQQQAAKLMPSIPEKASAENTPRLHRSSTGDDLRSNSLSRSASSDELNYSNNPDDGKIRVRVVNNNTFSSSVDPQMHSGSRTRPNLQRSILKPNQEFDDNSDSIPARRIYSMPNPEIGTETMEDLFKVVNQQRSESSRSASSPMTERIIVIDRRGSDTPDGNPNSSGNDRFRTFEIRATNTPKTPSTPPSPAPTPTPVINAPSNGYASLQPIYYPGQQMQMQYQQPKMYASVPNNIYRNATPYNAGANAYYPFVYYRY